MFYQTLITNLQQLNRLYKYRCWDNEYHRTLLTRSEIFFPPASKLDDPSETKVPISFEEGTDDQLLQMAIRIIRETEKFLPQDQVLYKAQNRLRQLRSDPSQFENFHAWEQQKKYCEFGIFSTSEIKSNTAMWFNYSDHHRGFCVGLRTDKLADYIQRSVKQHKIMPHPVEYYTDAPVLNPFEPGTDKALIKSLTIKSNKWAYQREHRLVLVGGVGKLMDHADRTIVLDDDIIAEVILGSDMSRKNEEEIISILKGRPNKVLLQKAELTKKETILFKNVRY